jgi:hypothetical protein
VAARSRWISTPARTAATPERRLRAAALQAGWSFCPFCASSATSKLTKEQKKKLREENRRLELPASNVTEFKNQNR